MLNVIAQIAEQKICNAMEQGAFDNLPGMGKPLVLEDLSNIPPDLRMAYKILKNAGAMPEELALRKEIDTLWELLDNCSEEKQRLKAIARLRQCLGNLHKGGDRHMLLEQADEYYHKIITRLAKCEESLKKP